MMAQTSQLARSFLAHVLQVAGMLLAVVGTLIALATSFEDVFK
jgi:hypothetical protein